MSLEASDPAHGQEVPFLQHPLETWALQMEVKTQEVIMVTEIKEAAVLDPVDSQDFQEKRMVVEYDRESRL